MAVPNAPTSLVATAADNGASITFTQHAAANPAITKNQYQIDGGGWVDFTVSPLVLTRLKNDKQVTVQIRSVNADGNSTAASVNVTPTDADLTNNNGFTDASVFANAGAIVPNLDFNDPDD